MRGFTLIELIIVVAIIMLLGALSVPFFQSFQVSSGLYTFTDEVSRIVRYAQVSAINGQNNDDWGVYFNESNKEYTIYKGSNYALRDTNFDLVFEYREIFSISTDFVNDEIIFSQYQGLPQSSGTITITSVNNNTYQIDISNIGLINVSY
ncbi:prepilin-type N-terminal cleavage/methylation domain-containing protein [Patescibacteria group bacterium]|nr:prepilin-type N-terminal cleavage/methylation domain-containing protein [Patescibacteria group bacterium]